MRRAIPFRPLAPRSFHLSLTLLLLGSACGSDEGGANSSDAGQTSDVTRERFPTWRFSSEHDCLADETSALWFDDIEVGWVGCGSDPDGLGVFTSNDRGHTWTELASIFTDWHVHSLARGGDGLLYVAGFDRLSDGLVGSIDTDVDPPATRVETGAVGLFQGPVGRVAVQADGEALASALRGTALIYRESADDDWLLLERWTDERTEFAMTDVVAAGGEFYGVGSTTATPPNVFLPAADQGADYSFHRLEVTREHSGELLAIAVASPDRLYAAGVDRDRDIGVIARSGGDPYDADDWRVLYIDDLVDQRSLLRDICASGSRVVAVGERLPVSSGTGIVLFSDDGGVSWQDATPTDPPARISACHLLPGGEIVVAGSDGYIAQFHE